MIVYPLVAYRSEGSGLSQLWKRSCIAWEQCAGLEVGEIGGIAGVSEIYVGFYFLRVLISLLSRLASTPLS